MSDNIEHLKKVYGLARDLIRSSECNATSGHRVEVNCDDEPYRALLEHFEAEREAERTILGLVCAECDRNIYRGEQYAGRTGNAAHAWCRDWPKGTTFKTAGETQQGAAK